MLASFLSTRGMFVALTCVGFAMTAASAEAQSWRFRFHSGGWPDHGSHHGSRHTAHRPAVHTPDLHALDRASNQLTQLVAHLHDDAHTLSPDCYHGAEIERTVSELEQLKAHMHELIHQASRHHRYSSSLDRHLKDDLRQVQRLLRHLDNELDHKAFEGARHSDFRRIQHMREIIAFEAIPWLRLMERELYGHATGDYSRWHCLEHSSGHHAYDRRSSGPRSPITIRAGKLRFSF